MSVIAPLELPSQPTANDLGDDRRDVDCHCLPEVTLDRLALPTACISRLDLPETVMHRLKAMGLFEGQDVSLSRRGNPMIVRAAGSKIALAHDLAHHIFVHPRV